MIARKHARVEDGRAVALGVVDHRRDPADPEPLNSTGLVDWDPPVPAAEPSVGLPPVRTIPGGEETPGRKTAVVDPKPLRESCPNPASIARGSRCSKTVRRSDGFFLCVRAGGEGSVASIHWFAP